MSMPMPRAVGAPVAVAPAPKQASCKFRFS